MINRIKSWVNTTGAIGKPEPVWAEPTHNHLPRDISVSCCDNGFVITVSPPQYDERARVYVVTSVEQLAETITLAVVNRQIAAR